MLRAAVQENADTMADRVPAPLRPGYRLLALASYWARVLMLPASIAVLTLAAHWSLAAEPSAVPPPASADSAPQALATVTPPSPPDLSLLERPLPTRALALGVSRVVLDAGHGGSQQGTS